MSAPDDRGIRISAATPMEEIEQILSSAGPDSLSDNDLVMASEVAWKQGRMELGATAMKMLVARQPQDAGMHLRLANFLLRVNEPLEAEKHCERAIDLAPDFEAAYLSLRHMRSTRGDFEGAVEAALAQERNCGSSPTLNYRVAQLLIYAGKLDEALATIRRVNDVGPPTEENLLLEAEIAQRLKLPHASASAAERAYRLWPDLGATAALLSRLLCHIGQYGMAVPVLRRTHALLPQDARICHLLAVALMATGQLRPALDAALAAASLKPDEAEYLYVAASLHDRLGESEQALTLIRQVIAMQPDRAQPRVTLAHMLGRSGDMEAAIVALAEAERIAPDNPGIRDLRLSWLGEHGPGQHGVTEQVGRPVVLAPMPKARRPRQVSGAGLGFLRSIAIQSNVVSALVLREFQHRASHSRFGLLTVFIPVALNVCTLGVVLSVFNHGRAPIGDHLFFFYATGVMPFYLFLHVVDHSQHQFLDSTSILQIPIVTRLDLVLAAAIAELLIMTATVVMTFGIFALISYGPESDNQIECVFAMMAVWVFAFGIGLISAVMTNLYRPWGYGWLVVNRFLYFLSGVFFIPLNMPVWVREPLSWNPLLQGIEWFRTGFFMRYDPPWLDKSYLVGAAFATLIVGLMLERALRRKAKAL